MVTMQEKIVIALNCSQCGSSLKIKEGQQIVKCTSCASFLLIKGGEGINKFYIPSVMGKSEAMAVVKKWFDRKDTANDIRISKIKTIKLVYVPLWKLSFKAIGWRFSRKEYSPTSYYSYETVKIWRDGPKRKAKPILRFGEWIVPACGITDFGSEYIKVSTQSLKRGLKVLKREKLQTEAMLFDVTIPAESILKEKEKWLLGNLPLKESQAYFFQRIKKLPTNKMLIYYPLWILRYDYEGRRYLVSVNGVENKIVYAHFPGNVHYRVFNFLIISAVINFVLTTFIQRPYDLLYSLLQMKELFVILLLFLGALLIGYFKKGVKSFRCSDEVVVKNGLRVDEGYIPAQDVWAGVGSLARKWERHSFVPKIRW